MKKTIFTVLILLLIVNTACKNDVEKPTKNEAVKEEVIIPKQLTISLNFKTNKADIFRIMMNNIQVDELQKKNIHIFENVLPTADTDAIVAKFDSDNFSNNIAINLGNKEVKEVTLIDIKISYGSNQIIISTPKDIDKFLTFNRFIERDSTSNTIITKKINGQHNPVISFKRNLINLLKKE